MCHLQALHQNMQLLFSTLAEAEEQQSYLQDSAVRRGTRCLAEYHLGEYGKAWNRCVRGQAGWYKRPQTEPLLPFSLLWTLVSFLLLPLSGSLIIITSLPKEGEKQRKLCSF